MAIYHCSLKTLSRSQGHSAVAAAAYRAGALLVDERSGITHRYHNRKGVVDAFICLPKSVPDVYQTRILDDKVTGSAETLVIREVWETLLNDALMRSGFDEAIVDRRTLEEQGIDRTPQIHIGKKSKAAQDAEGRETASDDDDEEDDEGDTDSGKSGKGNSLPPKAEQEGASEDSIAAAEETRMDKVYDQTDRGWRSDLVQEIKTLNLKRAAFEDIPLDQQILDLEHLMEKLDSRIG